MRDTTFPQEAAKWVINEWMALRKHGDDHGCVRHYALIVEGYRVGLLDRETARDIFRLEFAGCRA